jgi:hypothetical protein
MGKPGRTGPTLDSYLCWQELRENRVASGLSIDKFCVAEAISRSTLFMSQPPAILQLMLTHARRSRTEPTRAA